jgi:hypothetical protein
MPQVSGPRLTDAVEGTDPLKDNLPLLRAMPEDATPEVGGHPGVTST